MNLFRRKDASSQTTKKKRGKEEKEGGGKKNQSITSRSLERMFGEKGRKEKKEKEKRSNPIIPASGVSKGGKQNGSYTPDCA